MKNLAIVFLLLAIALVHEASTTKLCVDEGAVGANGQNMVSCADVSLGDIAEGAGSLAGIASSSDQHADANAEGKKSGSSLFDELKQVLARRMQRK